MPHRRTRQPIDAETLEAYQARGAQSVVLEGRLAYTHDAQLLNHFVKTMDKRQRVYPTMLPVQASGRWSITDPPMTTFPPKYRDVVRPDVGTTWLVWDWSAIEARIMAYAANDADDIMAFEQGWDIHTQTACGVLFDLPMPPDLTDPMAPLNEPWRHCLNCYQAPVLNNDHRHNPWVSKDPRRQVAKVIRYALLYSKYSTAVFQAKGVAALGLSRPKLLALAQTYLTKKVAYRTYKAQVHEACWRTRRSESFFGRPRLLYDLKQAEVEKKGLNHRIQSTVTDIMNMTLGAIHGRWTHLTLAWQSHDSGIEIVPDNGWDVVWPYIRKIVERAWPIAGHQVTFPATWQRIYPDGQVDTL